jgi:hypothetical protein
MYGFWRALAAGILVAVAAARPVRCDEDVRYFYHRYDYGSQSLYNPLWVFVNRGYDVLQDHVATSNIFRVDYRLNGGNVLSNLAHPFSAISSDGWGTFLTEEVFPLRFGAHTARWVPNYSLHLIGGGVSYTGLREWFEDHRAPLPRLCSAATLMAAALVNESLENKGIRGRNTDAIADVYIFDLGAIALFSIDAVNRFFSSQLVIADWSLQPAFTGPHGELHNQGNYFSAKWSLPFYPRLRLFSYFGEVTTAGLSVRLKDGYSISAAAGEAVDRLVNSSTKVVESAVGFAPTAAAFLDRNESLLASLQVADLEDDLVHLNLYPHLFDQRGPAIGFWTVVDKRGRVALGISLSQLLGMGAGYNGIGVQRAVGDP